MLEFVLIFTYFWLNNLEHFCFVRGKNINFDCNNMWFRVEKSIYIFRYFPQLSIGLGHVHIESFMSESGKIRSMETLHPFSPCCVVLCH